MTFEEFWEALREAQERGWVSEGVCATHDGLPMTDEEEAEWEEGLDPCVPAFRLWGEEGKP